LANNDLSMECYGFFIRIQVHVTRRLYTTRVIIITLVIIISGAASFGNGGHRHARVIIITLIRCSGGGELG
jgi:hypothetical protein